MKTFYITTTLPYINADPHLGFAKEIINADIIARYKRQRGYDVFFNTGSDEHGQKIYEKFSSPGIDPLTYCDDYSKRFFALKTTLNLSFDNFIRTTDPEHIEAVKEFWKRCLESGDIYKKDYQIKYCVGCEMEKTDSELEDGSCPFHPDKKIEIIDEENYFFRFSKYQDELLKLYKENPDFVKPSHRQKEIKTFVEKGLKDFSISRLKEKMPWGVPVPGDDTQVIYVWFDALVNYISCLAWPKDSAKFEKFWPGLQVCGKDNLRPQTAMWPAMLMSAGIERSEQVLVFGFLNSEGKKISKSLGDTINPFVLSEKYGSDLIRYYLVKEIPSFEDGDFSIDGLERLYTSDLVNGLGNLVSRLSNLIDKFSSPIKLKKVEYKNETPLIEGFFQKDELVDFDKKMDDYNLSEALKILFFKIKKIDEFLSEKAPWKMEDLSQRDQVLQKAAEDVLKASLLLFPFIPESAGKIIKQFNSDKIKKEEILFPRLKIN